MMIILTSPKTIRFHHLHFHVLVVVKLIVNCHAPSDENMLNKVDVIQAR